MRSYLRAPKFWPANTENENATWLNSTVASCSTLLPTVYAATVPEPNELITDVVTIMPTVISSVCAAIGAPMRITLASMPRSMRMCFAVKRSTAYFFSMYAIARTADTA